MNRVPQLSSDILTSLQDKLMRTRIRWTVDSGRGGNNTVIKQADLLTSESPSCRTSRLRRAWFFHHAMKMELRLDQKSGELTRGGWWSAGAHVAGAARSAGTAAW